MVDDSTATSSAVALAAGLRAREFSSRELLELYLDRIDRLDGDVHAVVTLDADRARAAADAADDAIARGGTLGRSTASRSRSRTPSRPRASVPPAARAS